MALGVARRTDHVNAMKRKNMEPETRANTDEAMGSENDRYEEEEEEEEEEMSGDEEGDIGEGEEAGQGGHGKTTVKKGGSKKGQQKSGMAEGKEKKHLSAEQLARMQAGRRKKGSIMTGLQIAIPPHLMRRRLKRDKVADVVPLAAAVYIAAAVEALIDDVIITARDFAVSERKQSISARHIMSALVADEELSRMFKNVTVANGGIGLRMPPAQELLPSKPKPKPKTKSKQSKTNIPKESDEENHEDNGDEDDLGDDGGDEYSDSEQKNVVSKKKPARQEAKRTSSKAHDKIGETRTKPSSKEVVKAPNRPAGKVPVSWQASDEAADALMGDGGVAEPLGADDAMNEEPDESDASSQGEEEGSRAGDTEGDAEDEEGDEEEDEGKEEDEGEEEVENEEEEDEEDE